MLELIFSIIILGICVWAIYAVFFLAPWLPTFTRDIARIAEAAQLEPGDVFYELGAGDGRVSLTLGKMYPQVSIVGIEISFILFMILHIRQFFAKVKNVTFVRGDIYRTDLSDARSVYVFATHRSAKYLAKYLSRVMRPGARVISYNFQLPFDTSVAREIKDEVGGSGSTLYIYDIVKKD